MELMRLFNRIAQSIGAQAEAASDPCLRKKKAGRIQWYDRKLKKE